MHEISIAHALLQQVREHAAGQGWASVQKVGVCVGDLSGVVPDALAFAFEVLRAGPLLGAASLEVRQAAGTELHLEWLEGM